MRPQILEGARLPRRLADMASPPVSVFLWGRLPPEPYVAVVGSRRASEAACAFVRALAAELSEAGVTVISGGAKGIDAAAHQGALDAGAPTLVVAPCGLDKPYPADHTTLFQRIVAKGGGYLALSADEQGARREHFHRRNAVLAALCAALVVGESHVGSGARNAAKHARHAGRAVFGVPSAAWNGLGRGSNQELRAGARWLEEPRDVLRYLAEIGQLVTAGPLARQARSPKAEGSPRQLTLGEASLAAPNADLSRAPSADMRAPLEAVGAALRAGNGHVDALCEATGLSAAEVNVALCELTLRGLAGMGKNGLLCWVNPPSR